MSFSSLHNHYHQPDLTQKILGALAKAGIDPDCLSRNDLDLLDEFHIRGRAATLELATMAQLNSGHNVLDLGCGIGGPARHLAAEYGCNVVGLDLVASYCEAAVELTRLVGLNHLVSFQQGDMNEMPFPDASFDCVWSQHTLMNIPDKAALTLEIRRVLRPHGKVVVYEVCQGNGDSIDLPVPWASTPDHSHLCSESELRKKLADAGLLPEVWEDVTGACLAWIDGLAEGLNNMSGNARPRPGLGLLMGADAGAKSRNLVRNLREGKIVVVQGVAGLG